MYFDVNTFYGAVKLQPSPYGNFQWVPTENIHLENILSNALNNQYEYILDVDLEYPRHLFELHEDLP